MKNIVINYLDKIINDPEIINSDKEMDLDISFANGIVYCAQIIKKVVLTEFNINNDVRFVNSILEKLNRDVFEYEQEIMDGDVDGYFNECPDTYTAGFYDSLISILNYVENLIDNPSFTAEFKLTKVYKGDSDYDEWDD